MGVRWRPVAVGVLGLIALQTLTASRGPEAAAGLMAWTATGVRRLLSPEVAAIPNRTGYGQPGPPVNVDPKTGVPNQDPSKPFLRDPQGRIY